MLFVDKNNIGAVKEALFNGAFRDFVKSLFLGKYSDCVAQAVKSFCVNLGHSFTAAIAAERCSGYT